MLLTVRIFANNLYIYYIIDLQKIVCFVWLFVRIKAIKVVNRVVLLTDYRDCTVSQLQQTL